MNKSYSVNKKPWLPLAHVWMSLMHNRLKWHTTITVNMSPWHTIRVHKNTILWRSSREQEMHKFTPAGPNTVWLTFVTVICNQLSNIPNIFRHYDLLVLNKSHEKKLQDKNNSFTDCHTEGLTMKAN